MKKILILLLAIPLALSSQIPLNKIITFPGNKYSVAADWLTENGWEFKGLDTTDGLHSKWAKNYQEKANVAEHWIRLYFKKRPKINKDSVYEVMYTVLSQQEYLDYYKGLPLLGFYNKKTQDFQGYLSTTLQKKVIVNGVTNIIMVELAQFTEPGISGLKTYRQALFWYLD